MQSQPLNNKSQLKGQRYNELRRHGFNTTLHQKEIANGWIHSNIYHKNVTDP
jgi:hypothetical protein